MSQRPSYSHIEAIANSIIGAGLAQLVLWLFGIPISKAIYLNAVMIGVSYGRTFVLRRIFARIEMTNLTDNLMKHFKGETAWRPGLGIWIGDTVQRLFRLETKLDSERAHRGKMEMRIASLESEIEKFGAYDKQRAFKAVHPHRKIRREKK